MFASKSILIHLGRGAVGFGALAGATVFSAEAPWAIFAALPLALVALRGCPMCWTGGLVQTVFAKMRGTSTEGLCTDGSCAVR
jgi:hypothetical protein